MSLLNFNIPLELKSLTGDYNEYDVSITLDIEENYCIFNSFNNIYLLDTEIEVPVSKYIIDKVSREVELEYEINRDSLIPIIEAQLDQMIEESQEHYELRSV